VIIYTKPFIADCAYTASELIITAKKQFDIDLHHGDEESTVCCDEDVPMEFLDWLIREYCAFTKLTRS